MLWAADRVANAALWMVVHQTYANRVRIDGHELMQEEFKADPDRNSLPVLPAVGAFPSLPFSFDLRS